MTMSIYDSTLPYPRDLIGYGRHVPHAQWPGGARVACLLYTSDAADE